MTLVSQESWHDLRWVSDAFLRPNSSGVLGPFSRREWTGKKTNFRVFRLVICPFPFVVPLFSIVILCCLLLSLYSFVLYIHPTFPLLLHRYLLLWRLFHFPLFLLSWRFCCLFSILCCLLIRYLFVVYIYTMRIFVYSSFCTEEGFMAETSTIYYCV